MATLEKVYRVKRRRTGLADVEGFQKGNVLASYAHLHFPSRLETIEWLRDRCAGPGKWGRHE
jgi:cobyrinic acid a,c-diamide synthase